MPYPGPGTLPAPNVGGLSTSRTLVRDGVAAYFGGSWVNNIRAYQQGPLVTYGLSTVRAGWGKRINMADFATGLPVGRGMGAYAIVQLSHEQEYRRAFAGAPQLDGNSNIVAGGVKFIKFRITLQCFHLAETGYAEDAQADIDLLIEAIKQHVRMDRTLGMPGVITDAGETRYGIQVDEAEPRIDANDRTATWFTVRFEIRTQIVA